MVHRIFSHVYRVRLVGKQIKEMNRVAYCLLKWLPIGGALAAIWFA